jgi:hypothetical protein
MGGHVDWLHWSFEYYGWIALHVNFYLSVLQYF